jgi:hypothetical protein
MEYPVNCHMQNNKLLTAWNWLSIEKLWSLVWSRNCPISTEPVDSLKVYESALLDLMLIFFFLFSSSSFSFLVEQPNGDQGRVISEFYMSRTRHTHTVAKTPVDGCSARRRDLYLTIYTLSRDWYPCRRRDSKSQSQQGIGRRPSR